MIIFREERFGEIIFWFIEKYVDRANKLSEVLKERFPDLPRNFQYEGCKVRVCNRT